MTKQTLTQFLFSPKGRIPRSLFWRFYLMCSLLLTLTYVILVSLSRLLLSGSNSIIFFYGSIFLISLPFLYSFIIIIIKRLHDIDQSGWWTLLFFILYIDILGIIILLVLGIKKGTTGDNKYGPDPLQNKGSGVYDTEVNLPPSNNTSVPIKSSFSPLDRACKK